jgi:Xaa-Pro aminopeptidase
MLENKILSKIAGQILDEYAPTIKTDLHIPQKEYEERWRRIQEVMKEKGYDLLYVCGSELDRSDSAWLVGTSDPMIERYGVLLPCEGKPHILAGSEGGHVLEEDAEKSGAEISLLREFQISDEEYRWAHFLGLKQILRKMNIPEREGKVAVASATEVLPQAQLLMFQSHFRKDNVVFDAEILQLAKYEKSDTELAILQEANKIADAAFRGMLAVTVPGATELQVASVGDFIMKALGAERTGFVTIVTSGERNYTVIGPATNKIIRKGEMISMGLSPSFKGYHGVIRRTVYAGKEPDTQQQGFIEAVEGLYVTVMDATKKAAKEGLPSKYIDHQGKKFIETLKVNTIDQGVSTPHEPYTFIHNMGCSECQEGFGAVTPYTENPLGKKVCLAVDIALIGFEERGKPLFPVLYYVIENAFWKKNAEIGVYNKLPMNVQHLVGNTEPISGNIDPYYRIF